MTRLEEIGQGRYAHASGALWVPAMHTAFVADPHFGYGWAQRRRGELGPVIDPQSPSRLKALLGELEPGRVVLVGDVVHAPRPGEAEREAIETAIAQIRSRAELVVVLGNHDRGFLDDFGSLGLVISKEWQEGGIRACHGDRGFPTAEGIHLVAGHLHPVLRVRDRAGAGQRLRVFLTNSRLTVLPAFSPFSSGFTINHGLPDDLAEAFGSEPVIAAAITEKRVALLGPIAHLQPNLARHVPRPPAADQAKGPG